MMGYLDVRNNRVMIDIACNDPDNGLFAHRAQQIQVGVQFAELEAKRDPAPRFIEEEDDRIIISGKSWPTHGSKEWIGNWCWNGYWMDIPVAVDFLVWLHKRDLFDLTCGDDRLFNRWSLREPMKKDDRDYIGRMLGKPSTWSFT